MQSPFLCIIELGCHTPQEKDANGDELRLEIVSDTGERVTLRQNNMKKGSRWGIDRNVACHKTVQFKLTELDSVKTEIGRAHV